MKLSYKILFAFSIVIVLSALDSFTNYRLSKKVISNTEFLTHSEAIIRTSARLHKTIIDMQSGFRGFLLTEDESFLDSYERGRLEVPQLLKEGKGLLKNPVQKAKLDSIESIHLEWLAYSKKLIDAKRKADQSPDNIGEYNLLFQNKLRKQVGKKLNDEMALLFRQMDAYEYQVRAKRREILSASIESTHITSFSFMIMTAIIGFASTFYIIRTITNRISFMVNQAGSIAGGDFCLIDDNQNDELSGLSLSLNLMSQKLMQNFTDLNRRNLELDQFASVVSHDLRAPLRGIYNVVSWIEEDLSESLSEELKKYLIIIQQRIGRMENLISALLHYARVSRNDAVKEKVDLKELVNSIIDSIVPRTFQIIVGHLPVIVTDRIRLEQVISNLISNAVKYAVNENGKITVSFKELSEVYEFTIEDNGVGIDPQFHDKIFGIFQTLREKNTEESTGIGLAIVKKIITEQKGSIKVHSELGKGAAFIFTWPKQGNKFT
ncbi:sensor histidine kinase [Desertivirga brevis]|uniref:sensor histidine kinase n=1 Tax=Desertivirga brevis TaxID=2810310 RepID=UPI001A95C915|nr:sensor histidine kinase [Pedobacter sp. SYSU D00873]